MHRNLKKKKTNLGQCYCSSCAPKRVSSGLCFGYFNEGKIFFAVCYEFIDRHVKNLNDVPVSLVDCNNIVYTKGWCCINFCIESDFLLS